MDLVTGFKRYSKVQNLKDELEKLRDKRARMQHSFEVAKGKGEEIDPDVQGWATRAEEKIKEEEATVKDLEAEAKKRCFFGLCPNFKSVDLLNKRAEEHTQAVLELIEQAESHKFNKEGNFQKPEKQAEADKTTGDEAEKVIKVQDEAENRSSVVLDSEPKSPDQVSDLAEDDTKATGEKIEKGRFDGGNLYAAETQKTESRATQDYGPSESREATLENIMEALKDPDLKVIGVYGMTGVGKTTLVKEAARRAREENLFDEVAMATVSRNPNIKEIQRKIADALGLKFYEESVFARAMRLQQWLKKEDKRVLLILDDIWQGQRLELEEVGIAFDGCLNIASEEDLGPLMQNVSENAFQKSFAVRFKILLTSTTQEVLVDMKTARMFEVQALTDKEAMRCFEIIAGTPAMQAAYQQILTGVVKNCAGFPVAILAISRALRRQGSSFLVDALRKERKPIPIKDEKLRTVYSTIELSYSLLEKPEWQSFFQLCALLPQGSDIHVSDLLRYNLGLKIARSVSTLEKARESVNKLKDAGLLLSNDNDEVVKMHDIVRDVSIWIASEEKRMFVIEDEIRMNELLKQGTLKNCSAISLPYSNIHELPPKLECPRLKLLLLLNKNPSLEVPDAFFSGDQ